MRVTCVSIAAALILGVLFAVAGRWAGAQQCLYTRGYWTTHGDTWPLQAMVLGRASYSQSESDRHSPELGEERCEHHPRRASRSRPG